MENKIKYLITKNDNNALSSDIYNFVSKLKQLYPKCVHDKTNQDIYKQMGHAPTYGEMEYDGFDRIMQYFSNNNVDTFIDIGCGRGKLCLYARSFPNIKKSFGIEIVKDRYNDALNLLDNVKNFKYSSDIHFINDDFRNFDVEQLHNKTPFVWISNLCFERKTTNDFFDIILNKFPKGSIIACSKIHTITDPNILSLGTLNVDMSWSKNSTVYCYKIIK